MRFRGKTLLACGLCVAAGVPGLRADEMLRRAQQALHEQGFYYGAVDGAPGDETTQAVRRYQIRNGLAVTGVLNDETLNAIAKTGPAAKTPAPRIAEGDQRPPAPVAPPPAPAIDDDDDEEPTRPDLRLAPPGAVRPSATLMTLFAGTPYEFAPPPVQADLLRRAQFRLMRSGFYGGEADGVPGNETAGALAEFQAANGLRRTGRLTAETLAALRLERVGPPSRRAGAGVYEGRVVR